LGYNRRVISLCGIKPTGGNGDIAFTAVPPISDAILSQFNAHIDIPDFGCELMVLYF